MQLEQFDVVQIVRQDHVSYLSAPQGAAAKPDGHWTITGFIGDDALISKQDTVIRIPVADIRPIAKYDLDNFEKKLRGTRGKKEHK